VIKRARPCWLRLLRGGGYPQLQEANHLPALGSGGNERKQAVVPAAGAARRHAGVGGCPLFWAACFTGCSRRLHDHEAARIHQHGTATPTAHLT
jgi:hypothetical protein